MTTNIKHVDKIKITVLIENTATYTSNLVAKHGMAYLLEITSSDTHKKILVDTGCDSESILYNIRVLDIDLQKIDMIFLTHCHYDHAGGLFGILKAIGKEIPIIAHNDIFRCNIEFEPFVKYVGIPMDSSKEEIISNRGNLILINESFQIMDGVLSTGQVERITDFEDTGVNNYNLTNGHTVKDMLWDDMSLIVNIKDKGLFIVTGCSHAGLINIIKHSIKVTGINKLHGIIGGFHLVNASNERINKTIEELKNTGVELIAGGHCTGFDAQVCMYKEFGDKFMPLHSGFVLEL